MLTDVSRELGEDYWIDEAELKKEKERLELLRKRDPGQVPVEKLWVEVKAPYKQNWIGFISVAIVALAFIIKQFPELLDTPSVSFPDL